MEAIRDLSTLSGFPLGLDLTSGEIALGDGVTSDPHWVRRLEDIRPLLADPAVTEGPTLLSHLYRAVRRDSDTAALERARLRYDLTVTMPGTLGVEFVKTTGHYHPRTPKGTTYPEVYEVLSSRAAFLLQRVTDPEHPSPAIQEVWIAICQAGEKIVIPPACGHVTVNIGTEPLFVSDLISLGSHHLYHPFREARGAAYYLLADPSTHEGFRVVKNTRYAAVPEPTVLSGSRWSPFLPEGLPLYTHFLEHPMDFAFLNEPEDYLEQMFNIWKTGR